MKNSPMAPSFLLICVLLAPTLSTQAQSTTPSSSGTDAAKDQKPAKPGEIYHVGGSVKAPKAIPPAPAVIDVGKSQGKKTYGAGSAILSFVVLEDGTVSDIKVAKSLNRNLDAKAVDVLRQWRFDPATRKGVPVAVQLAVQIDFHFYK
jgi:periplasmic protein TonB